MAYDEYFERPLDVVQQQINAMSGRANDALDATYAAVDSLKNIPSPGQGTGAPTIVLPTDDSGDLMLPKAPSAPDGFLTDALVVPTFTNGDDLTADLGAEEDGPAYNPPVTSFNIPTVPSPIDLSGLPTAPAIADTTIPDAPPLEDAELGNILQVQIPTFAGLNLPTFSATPPVFTELKPQTLAWGEPPPYTSMSLDTLKATMARMFQGGTGLPPSIETALFERSADRVDLDAQGARQDAVDQWGGRNFDMPPGMLVEQDNAAREAAQLQKNTHARDVLVQAATWEIENLRFVVQQGIALEGVLIGLYQSAADRSLQAARARVDADVAIYNASVQVFQALYQGYAIAAQVYEAEIRGELAKLEGFKAEIEAQQLIGQVNEQTVRIYQARLQGLTNKVELYRARVTAAQAFIDSQRTKVQMYGEGVQAYAARVNADKVRFDAYTAQIQGETAKAQLVDAYSRAFAAEVEGFKSKNDIKVARVQARVAAMNAASERFTAQLGAERERFQAAAEAFRSKLAVFQGQTQLYTASADVAIRTKGLAIQKYEAVLRNAIAYYEVIIKEFDAAQARLEQESEVRVKAFETIAQVGSQIAAGAFAAMHVSAAMEGRASASSDVQETHRFNEGPLP